MNLFEVFLEASLKVSGRMPGFVAAKRAIIKGEPVGILTARSNKAGHEELLRRLEKSLGKSIPREDIHFVNDPGYSGENTAEKKLEVLKRYASKYAKVKFYDDEDLNIKIVQNSGIPNIKTYNVKQFDPSKLKPLENTNSNKNVIHILDMDGTVWKLPAFIKVVKDGKVVKTITQERFANGYKLKQGESFDFSDFSKKEKLEKHAKKRGIFNS